MAAIRLLLLCLALFAGLFSVSASAVPAGYVGQIGRMGVALDIDPDAKAAIAAMTVKPDYSQQLRLSNLIRDLKYVCQCWSKLDMLQVYAQHDAQAALVDIRNPSRVATAVNSPTFTLYRDYAGDGATSFVDTGYNPATDAVAFSLNNGSAGIWSLSGGNLSPSSFGWFDGTQGITVNPRSLSDLTQIRLNNASSVNIAASTDGTGFFVSHRASSGTLKLYKNGVEFGSSSTASTAVANGNLRMGSVTNSVFSPLRGAAVYAGSAMTDAQYLALYNALRTYLVSVGAI